MAKIGNPRLRNFKNNSREKAVLWINHDKAQKLAPAYYD